MWSAREVIVLEVMGQFMDLDGAKPCLLEILHRHLLAPHRAETIATLPSLEMQSDSH
jgi:hypothetical protein